MKEVIRRWGLLWFFLLPLHAYALWDVDLTIESIGNGSVSFNGTTIRNESKTFKVESTSYVTLTLTPDYGCDIVSVKGGDLLPNNLLSVFVIGNSTVSVTFSGNPTSVIADDVNYTISSYADKTVTVAKGTYGQVLTVPATFNVEGATWTVTGIDANALSDNKDLAAIIWNPKTPFTGQVSNPNLLLYVTSVDYAPSTIKNIVVNSKAESITLTDAAEGNDFYCPQEFTAQRITYSHYYGMTTGFHESGGWETIALPFDVDRIEHGTKGTIIPFLNWQNGNSQKPFWLYEYGSGGFREASSIRANTPYIISMPNNEQYLSDYRLNGTVTFSASNTTVRKSDDVQSSTNGAITFVPNFMKRESNDGFYALNVKNDYVTNSTASADGSMFVRNSRAVLPFEAYMTTQAANAREFIPVFEDVPTGIREIELLKDNVHGSRFNDQRDAWYTLEGQKLSGKPEKKGVYIYNGKVVVR